MKVTSAISSSLVIAATSAQQPAYGQCGGINWSGSAGCVSGYVCTFQNQWYSQCVPGTATSSSVVTTAASSSVVTTSVKSTQSVPTTLATSTISSAQSSGTSSVSSFSKANGHVFSINGKNQYFMGTNTYWIGFLTNNADVDLVMSHIATTGLNVLRVWGFNDVTTTPGSGTVWYQSFVAGASPVINTGANGLQRLDYVVKSAEAHGVKLIINFVNNWTDYGGMAAYAKFYNISPVTGWYTSAPAQAQYQKYIAAVVSRYSSSSAIFAWELANEPRCNGCATSVLTNWISTTSKYIKSLDPNHMITIGDEGFGLVTGSDGSYPYSFGEGLNFTANLAIPTIDFGVYHLYPQSWGTTDAWAPGWITAHATAAAAIGKPVIMEEYGSTTKLSETAWQKAVLDSQTAGDMFWQYGDTISSGKTSDDGNTIYYGTDLYTTLVTNHAKAMAAKAV